MPQSLFLSGFVHLGLLQPGPALIFTLYKYLEYRGHGIFLPDILKYLL